MDQAFDFLPDEVKTIVKKDFAQLTDKEIAVLCENSAFEIPVFSLTLQDHDTNFGSNIEALELNDKIPDNEVELDIIEVSDSDSDEQEISQQRKLNRKRTQTVRFDPSQYK